MKILLTGGCGFIGSNLVRHLIRRTDHLVVNFDKLTYAGNPRSLADLGDAGRYEHHLVDVADPRVVRETLSEIDPDAVIHLAAESHVDRSIDGPAEFVQTNLVGTFCMLDAATRHFKSLCVDRRQHFRFLHVSTDEVYGSLGDEGSFHESSVYDPRSPYAASKAGADHLARAWHHTYGLPVLVTNTCNNYGPYQFPEKLIPLMILKCLREETLPVYGAGTNVREWVHVEDHVRALRRVLARGKVGETYHVGSGYRRRNLDLVRQICQIMDHVCPRANDQSYSRLIDFVADRPGHDHRYAIDSSKIRREIGWSPEIAFETGLAETVRWYVDHESWWQDVLNATDPLKRLGDAE